MTTTETLKETRFRNYIAQAKLMSVSGRFSRADKEGIYRRAEAMGIDQATADRIIEETPAAKRAEGRA